jgi:solute carrier family 40 (iron-regulated transporter), member 1
MLVGRFLTRSGDQAWDFAVPIVLLHLLPGELRVAALYFLLIRVATVVVLPRLTMLIDRFDRLKSATLGIVLQLAGVISGFTSIFFLPTGKSADFQSMEFIVAFTALVISGIVSQLGSSFMDIAIANDLVPSTFHGSTLTKFNSRLRQVDLATEVGSPVVTGLLLLVSTPSYPLLGFSLVALWNVLSFFPEYVILKSVFVERSDLKEKPILLDPSKTTPILIKMRDGWRSFFREPIAPVMLAYAILWLSALSPHGVLLTAFLKDGWRLPEWSIGIFRGLGAVFGLVATLLVPIFAKRMSIEKSSFVFLAFQAITLLIGLGFFFVGNTIGQIGFLVAVLFSRIGLYGFSLGEMQIRQTAIAPNLRGEVNGFASALTALATIGLYSAGVALPKTNDFKYLVGLSVGFVALALVIYSVWHRRTISK